MSAEPESGIVDEDRDVAASGLPGWVAGVIIIAALAAMTARLVDADPLQSANDRSRWCTVWSLVERGTYQIDEIRQRPGWDTIDLVRHEGHFYSSKPPLLPRMVAELYRGLKLLTGWTLTKQTNLVTRTILFLINIVPMGLALWAFWRIVQRYCTNVFGQAFLMTAAGWGVLLLPFLKVFNNHTVAASCFFIALKWICDIQCEGRREWWRYAASGLLLSFGICNELPAAAFGLGVFFLLVRRDMGGTVKWFVPAALIPIAAFFITNYQATGGWKPFYAYYGTEKYEFIYEGVPSYWMNPQGIDRGGDSTATYLFHCVLGHHGILSLSPIFLFTILSWLSFRYWWKRPLGGLTVLSAVLTIIVLAFYLSRTENYNYGGVSVALRWGLWLIPLWLIGMIPLLNAWGRKSIFQAVAVCALAVSVFSAWYPTSAPWTSPWIYQLLKQTGRIDDRQPPPPFEPRDTWIEQLPNGERQPDYSVTFQARTASGVVESLRIDDRGPIDRNGRSLRQIAVQHQSGSEPISENVYLLDVERFNAHAPVAEFLVGRQGGELTDADRKFFRGVSGDRAYRGSRIRYEKIPLRRDAFRCQVAYSYANLTDGEVKLHAVRDVWLSAEIPFGVLKWEDRLQKVSGNRSLARQLWTVQSVGKLLPVEGSEPPQAAAPQEASEASQ